jgi:hypothetical protein
MTLTEFLHQFKDARRKLQFTAVLYYWKHYDGREQATGRDIRAALKRARLSAAGSANLPRDLVNAIPYIDRGPAPSTWVITGTGEKEVRKLLNLPATEAEADVSALRDLADGVSDEATRGYIEEALTCLQAGARRAAVVFLWTGAVEVIRGAVWGNGALQIQTALQRHNPKAKFAKRADFESVKDKDLIQLAQDLAIFDKSEKKRLGEALDLRNDCGHPVKYRPGEKKVSSFIEDLLGIVFA